MRISEKLALLAIAITLTACGGGGSASVAPPPDDNGGGDDTGGITRNGVAAGPVSNFGSVIVNGIRFETDSATFTINGEPGTQSDLAVGQFVVAKGELNDDLVSGSASDVVYEDNVKGPVQSVDAALNRLVVLGQTVFVDASTSFDDNISPASIDGIAIDDIVEVSGLVGADGSITATRIEKKPAGTVFEVLGIVSSHDGANQLFQINALTVDYNGATLDNFPGGAISDGDLVEAKGSSLAPNGALIASSVELKTGIVSGADGDRVEIEGLITRFASSSDFDVSGVPVSTSGSTVFEGGVAADLGLNIKVEVEGDFDANGTIVASKVDIRRAKVVRVVATVDSVDAANNSLVVLDISVSIDALSRLEDKSNADVDPLTTNDLNAGDYLEIRGSEFPAGSGSILAAIVEREDSDPETILQGFVTAFGDPTITILGVTIETNGAVFRDVDDTVLSRAEFFNQLAVDSLVKAKGTESSSNVINATEVEFEFEQ